MTKPLVSTGDRVDTARRAIAAALRAQNVDTAELDARLLVGHVLKLDLTGLARAALKPCSSEDAAAINAVTERRLSGVPIARILGMREFWGLPLALSSATLVPRPDTETVVDLALECLRADAGGQPMIADLGTGSGAILLALLSEFPDAQGVGTDLSEEALSTARENAMQLGLAARAQFIRADYGQSLAGPFDLVVSNPPYIRSNDIAGLATEVRDHDPRLALDGGQDGLDAYRSIAGDARRLLRPGGTLIVEIGAGQADAVVEIFRAAGLDVATPARRDLAGHERALQATVPADPRPR